MYSIWWSKGRRLNSAEKLFLDEKYSLSDDQKINDVIPQNVMLEDDEIVSHD